MTDTDEREFDRRALRRSAIGVTIGLWALHYIVLTLVSLAHEYAVPFELWVVRAAWSVLGMLICAAIYFALELMQVRSFRSQVALLGGLAVPAGILQVLGSRQISAVMIPHLYDPDATLGNLTTVASYWMWFYFAWAAIILALSYSVRVRAEQRLRAEAQALAHQAQLRTLRYQLNPHFLFNTLNSVAALVLDGRRADAERMIRQLSAFLRSGLATDPLEDVPLRFELDQQQIYLDIERARFPERLSVVTDVPPDLESALVPSFILQPLIENAIKHGVAPSSLRTTVTIAARRKNGRLSLSITDDGIAAGGEERSGTGIGLRNIRERLAARFGDDYAFSATPCEPHGFAAEIQLPLRLEAR